MMAFMKTFSLFLVLSLIIPVQTFALDTSPTNIKTFLKALELRCIEYGWTDINPNEIKWEYHRTTQRKYPLVFTQFGSSKNNCILFLGAVHGDELSTVYVLLKFAHYIKDNPALFKDKCIIIAPLVNPDGFFSKPSERVNANGVDINRNFPTRDWSSEAVRQWEGKYNSNRRYYPGKKPGSEQETLFQIALIKRFKPQKILSVHSPLGFFDFDGPSSDLDSFERWLERISKDTNHPLKKYGYFPGSLGNYAGHERDIFTLTLELPSSDTDKGNEYFLKFQTPILKFINLPILIYHAKPFKHNPKR